MNSHELNKCIEQSLRNDLTAFRLIVENYQALVYSLSFRLLCNEEEAKDLTQETFIRVWTNLAKYKNDKKFSTWIYSIATNLCLDKLKSAKRHLQTESNDELMYRLVSTESADTNLLTNELAGLIQSMIDELTPKQKIVFILRYVEELDVDEIVQITGMTPEKIKSNLFLARQTIRLKLEKY